MHIFKTMVPVAKAGKVVIKSIALIIQIIGVAPVCRSIREGIQGGFVQQIVATG